jgi:hypothetical protein
MSSEARRKLTRPRTESIRTAVFVRCEAADAEFYAAMQRALEAQVNEFPALVADAESPTEVLQYMDSLHTKFSVSNRIGLYNRAEDDDDYARLCAAVQRRVLFALERYFVAYAAENDVEIDDAYRALWCRGSFPSVVKPFAAASYKGYQTYKWRAIFNGLFEQEQPFCKRPKRDNE